ncbi:hypothetical protein, partial [Vibrio sp. S9_S30]|uniref:hypothetical protein n=1 Tax=Vibrio sp. S9_S30 TaxID=2720226 RepID=UPI001EED8C9F
CVVCGLSWRYSALKIQGLSGSRKLLASVFSSSIPQPYLRWEVFYKPSFCGISCQLEIPDFEVWFSVRSCKLFDWFGVLGIVVWLQQVLLSKMAFVECKRSASLPSKACLFVSL